MHVPFVHRFVPACINACACMPVACVYKMFAHSGIIHYFIAALSTKRDLSKQQTKMSDIKKDLKMINKETAESGLKRKREPENIVGTKKSKKRLRSI